MCLWVYGGCLSKGVEKEERPVIIYHLCVEECVCLWVCAFACVCVWRRGGALSSSIGFVGECVCLWVCLEKEERPIIIHRS